jgi:hypothetical protein
LDSANESIRQNINSEYEDDEYFYADHMDEFEETLQNGESENFQYEYENVLNGSRNTFGLEIEIVNGDNNAIARELYDLGICGYDHQVRYHARSIEGKWKLEKDASLGSGGGELVSPPLTDTPETWRTLETICKVAKRHGAQVDSRCGGHLHINMNPLDTAKQRWKRFFKTTGTFEPVMYRFAGGDTGQVRSGVSRYATPFASNASRALTYDMPVRNSDDINRLATFTSRYNRYYGINLTNIYDDYKPNTIELRYFNSSLTPSVLQANVKIGNGIIFASEKARFGSSSESAVMKRRGNILKNQSIGSIDQNNDLKVRDFVDIAFTRKKDKDAVLKLYSKNRWYS